MQILTYHISGTIFGWESKALTITWSCGLALMCSGPKLPRLQWMIITPHFSDCFCYSWTIFNSFVQKPSHLRPNQSQLECNGWLEITPKPYQGRLKLKSWNCSRWHWQISRGPLWIYTPVKVCAIITQVKSYMAKVSNVLEGFTNLGPILKTSWVGLTFVGQTDI
jgi:hypothetical protein